MNGYSQFVKSLLTWHKLHSRELPWRVERTPYNVLISEFLLQKTDAKKAAYVFLVVIKKYPNILALSNANPDHLEKYLKGIGLRYRSIRMIKTAQHIIHKYKGIIPSNLDDLMNLPGIGRYIASAILCFAFSKPVALVDTNIARILLRFWNKKSKTSRPREDKSLWEFATKLVPCDNTSQYNYALLDLGALVCHPRSPKCNICPLSKDCLAKLEI